MHTADDVRLHIEAAVAAARQHGGTVSGPSAALEWGWDVLAVPVVPHITVPRGRRLDGIDRRAVAVRRMSLPRGDIAGMVTQRGRTLVDCFRQLDFADALVIGDSALRDGFPAAELKRIAATAKGPRSIKVRRVAQHVDRKAANLFESALRAICMGVSGLNVSPQVPIGDSYPLGRPDLVDVRLRIVIEADSFEWHGYRSALVADAERYNGFVADGWLVLRFTWEDVMLRPELIREVLERVVSVARTNRGSWGS